MSDQSVEKTRAAIELLASRMDTETGDMNEADARRLVTLLKTMYGPTKPAPPARDFLQRHERLVKNVVHAANRHPAGRKWLALRIINCLSSADDCRERLFQTEGVVAAAAEAGLHGETLEIKGVGLLTLAELARRDAIREPLFRTAPGRVW